MELGRALEIFRERSGSSREVWRASEVSKGAPGALWEAPGSSGELGRAQESSGDFQGAFRELWG
eukprot:10949529-Alexandrium_andersonii.AAC.1